MSRSCKDLTGKQFGYLTVVSFHGNLKPDNKKDKKPAWLCVCKCKREVVVRSSCLNWRNHVRSCFACARADNGLKYSNLVGKRFGRLVVLSKAERPNVRNGSQYWNVVCDCGTYKVVSTSSLNTGTTVSCGCFNRDNASKIHTTHGLSKDKKAYKKYILSDPAKKLRHYVGCHVRDKIKIDGGKKDGSVWKQLPYSPDELRKHLESLWEPWMNWDNYGGLANEMRKTWWIDHVIPQSSFVFSSLDDQQFMECWSLKNIAPLEKKANIKKGARI